MDAAIVKAISCLCDTIVREIKCLINVDDTVNNTLNQALEELKIAQGEVNRKIQSGKARADEEEPTERTHKWLERVQAIETKVASLVEGKYKQRKTCTLCLGGGYKCPLNCWSSYRISKKATNLTAKVKELITYKEEKMKVVIERLEVPAVKKKPPMPKASATVQSCLDAACNYIQDNGVGMVGIYGMGGVGKTSLLRRINNDPVVQDGGFDRVISVVASKDINLHKLQTDVAEAVGFKLSPKAATTEEEHGEALYGFLKTKKILLFLDDIWEPVELKKLGVHFPRFPPISSDDEKVPKVVFTTRSLDVYNKMVAYHEGVSGRKIRVECLQWDEAWQLFLDNVGEAKKAIESNKKVRKCAEGVAKKCGGLPLALKVIARAMCCYTTYNQWEGALVSFSEFDINDLWRNKDGLFPLLKKSYDRLSDATISDATMKQCFLYCATYPEDYIISEEELIMHWMGLNIINDSKNFKLAYDKGVSIIQSLIRAALLEEVENYAWKFVKMHDLIREMALWIVSEKKLKWIIQSGTQAPTNSWSGSELILLQRGKKKNVPQHPTTGYPKLFALFLHYCRLGNLPDLLHQNLSALTCLELYKYENISELPSSIGCLAGLRYLYIADLGENDYSLPMELSNLKELRYLIIKCIITSIPFGLISKLRKLEVLEISAYKRWGMEGQAKLDELHFLSLKALVLNIYTLSMITQIYRKHQIPLWSVRMTDLKGVTTLALLKINLDRVNIRNLEFRECNDLEEIQITGREDEEEFTNLQSVIFMNLPKIQRMTWAGGVKLGVLFGNITGLCFNRCPMIKNLTWIGQLTNLERLYLINIVDIEQIINDNGEEDDNGEGGEIRKDEETILSILSHLKCLGLSKCPKLRSFSSHTITFPSLKYVRVRRCPILDLSPFSNPQIRTVFE